MSSILFSKIIANYNNLKYDLLKAQTFDENHFGFPPIYYKVMESDQTRIQAFYKAFDKLDFDNKIVCEAGIGNMVLTKHYLSKVKKAYLIENNPDLFESIQQTIQEHKWEDKVELIWGDAMQVHLPEKVDIIIGELMSIFCINEFQVPIFRHLRQFLKPDGHLLPQNIINTIQLANTDFEEEKKHYPINFSRHLPTIFSLPTIVNTIDLYKINTFVVHKKISITPLLSGKVNAVYLHSMVEITEGCNFTGTDSLMPPTVCRLETEKEIVKGKTIILNCEFTYGTSLDATRFWIEAGSDN